MLRYTHVRSRYGFEEVDLSYFPSPRHRIVGRTPRLVGYITLEILGKCVVVVCAFLPRKQEDLPVSFLLNKTATIRTRQRRDISHQVADVTVERARELYLGRSVVYVCCAFKRLRKHRGILRSSGHSLPSTPDVQDFATQTRAFDY